MTATAKNRAEFPATAQILDEFRNEFGEGVKLLYACEGGREVGKKPVVPKRFMTVAQWLKCSGLIAEAEARLEFSAAKSIVRRGVQ